MDHRRLSSPICPIDLQMAMDRRGHGYIVHTEVIVRTSCSRFEARTKSEVGISTHRWCTVDPSARGSTNVSRIPIPKQQPRSSRYRRLRSCNAVAASSVEVKDHDRI